MRSCLLALLALVPAAPAAAQDITAQVLSMDGRTSVDLVDLGSQTATPISGGECTGSAQIDFRFTNVDPSRSNLHLYFGTGCEDPTIRTDTTNSSCTDLELEFAVEGRSQVDATIGADQLVECGVGTSGTRTIWVLAEDEPTSTVTGAGQKVSFPIAFDFSGPAAPTGFEAVGGETAATLSWEGSSDQVTEYEVFFVPGGCSGGSPTATIDPTTDSPFATVEGTNRSYNLVYGSDVGIGTESAVAIRALDRAGNASELSVVVCVDRFEVTSWWDAYCGGGSSDACSGGECAVRPGRSGTGVPGALLFAAVAWLALRRRTR